MSIAVTALYAGLLGLWFLVLSARVILQRRAASISLGHGTDRTLERRVRGHGNFAEYVPLALVLLALLEMQGAALWMVHALGASLLVARLLHGYALSFTDYSPLRVPGAALTLFVLGLLALANVAYALT